MYFIHSNDSPIPKQGEYIKRVYGKILEILEIQEPSAPSCLMVCALPGSAQPGGASLGKFGADESWPCRKAWLCWEIHSWVSPQGKGRESLHLLGVRTNLTPHPFVSVQAWNNKCCWKGEAWGSWDDPRFIQLSHGRLRCSSASSLLRWLPEGFPIYQSKA